MLTANFTKGRKSGADILDIARITNGQRTYLEAMKSWANAKPVKSRNHWALRLGIFKDQS